jgi:hypothetical protein
MAQKKVMHPTTIPVSRGNRIATTTSAAIKQIEMLPTARMVNAASVTVPARSRPVINGLLGFPMS